MTDARSKEQIAAELLRRGVPPEQIAAAGYPQVARQGQTGLIAPRLEAPDEVAARQAYGKDYGSIRDAREALGRVAPVEAQLDRFRGANALQPTGGIQSQDYQGWERAAPWNWPGMVANGLSERWDPEYQTMSGIASVLQGQSRPVGSGATSDFEQRLYRQGVPSPEKLGPVNDGTIAYMKGTLAEENDRLAFQEEFLRRNGSLNGATQAWVRYTQANPYGVTGAAGYRQNTKRQPWDQYFGVKPSTNPKERAQEAFFATWTKKRGTSRGADQAFAAWWPQYARQKGIEKPPSAGQGASAQAPTRRTPAKPSGVSGMSDAALKKSLGL